MNFRLTFLAVSSVALALLGSATAHAQILNPLRSGWVNQGGSSSGIPANHNYLVGNYSLQEHRNFFVFDLTGIHCVITSASLELYNPSAGVNPGNGYGGDATETYDLTSTTSAPGALLGNFSVPTATAAFATLGTGSLFASVTTGAASNGTTLVLNFNAAGLAYLNANLGQQGAFGGRVSSLSGTSDQHFFAFSDPTGGNPLIQTPPVNLVLQQGAALTP